MCACGVSVGHSAAKASCSVSHFSLSSSSTSHFLLMQCAGSGRLVFSAFRQNWDHVVCFGLRVFAGACHVWVGDAIGKQSQGSLCSSVRGAVVVVVVALLPKISAEERDQMSKDVAVASQRVSVSESIYLLLLRAFKSLRRLRPRRRG